MNIIAMDFFRRFTQFEGIAVLRNLALGVSAVMLMHLVLQLLLYPAMNRKFGENEYGEILFLISVMSIFSISFGTATDNARLILRHQCEPTNGDCNLTLLIFGIIALAGTVPFAAGRLSHAGAVGFALLAIVTMVRYYSAVEYRMNIDYIRYFLFFAILAAGYGVGTLLLEFGAGWITALLVGEIAVLIFVCRCSTIFRSPLFEFKKTRQFLRTSFLLAGAEFLYNLIQNLDRVLLIYLINPAANTQYYVVSLIGKTPALLVQPLNSVCISYLTRTEKHLGFRCFLWLTAGIMGFGGILFIGCLVATPIFLNLVYPDLLESVSGLVVIVCMGQILCFQGNILLVVILTLTGARWQLALQSGYAILFLGLAFPLTRQYGITGFAWAALAANGVRLLAAILLGIWKIDRKTSMNIIA